MTKMKLTEDRILSIFENNENQFTLINEEGDVEMELYTTEICEEPYYLLKINNKVILDTKSLKVFTSNINKQILKYDFDTELLDNLEQ